MPRQKHELVHYFNFSLHEEIMIVDTQSQQTFHAKVVGLDRYLETLAAPNPNNPLQGLKNSWISYTLTSEDAPEQWGNRFWAVDSQGADETGNPRLLELQKSFYVASNQLMKPEGFDYDPLLSGRVDLAVEGEALHSHQDADAITAQGHLATYRNKQGEIWAEEAFTSAEGVSERMVFDALFSFKYERI